MCIVLAAANQSLPFIGATAAGLYFLRRSPRNAQLASVAQLLLAISCYELWGRLLFKIVSAPIIQAEMSVISKFGQWLGYDFDLDGILLVSPNGWSIFMMEDCSSFHNISLAVLVWLSLIKLAEAKATGLTLAALCAGVAGIICVNGLQNPADDSLGTSLPFLAQWKWRYNIFVRDLGGDCIPNDRLYTVSRCMRGLRISVILIILVALAGGIWPRHLYKALEPTAPAAVEIRRAFESSNLQVTGTFAESLGNTTGFEISIGRCARPLAVLPIPAAYSAIIPTEYRYRAGAYDIAYVYSGSIYPEERISFRLSLLNIDLSS